DTESIRKKISGSDNIEFIVAVKIRDGDIQRLREPGWISHRALERAVTIVYDNCNVVVVGIGNDENRFAVAIEIACRDALWTETEIDRNSGRKSSITVAGEKAQGRAVTTVRHHHVR